MGPRRGVPPTLVATLVYAVVAVALSWPLPMHLGSRVIGDLDHPGCRGDLFYQHDMHEQMEQGQFPRHRRLVTLNHPQGLELPARDMFAAHLLVYAALMTVFGLLVSHNLAVLGMVVANALSMHLLIRERTRREDFAYLSGLVFGFGSYVFLKVQQGFPQKACLFLLPLFVLFLLRAIEHRRARDHVAVLGCLFAMLWIYPPYAVFDVVFAAAVVFYRAFRGGRSWEDVWPFAPSLVVVVLAFLTVAYTQRGDMSEVAVSLADFREEGGFMPLLHPFLFFPYLETFEVPPADFVRWLPLGFPIALTGLAVLGVVLGGRDARLMALIGGAFVLVMAGPYFGLGGDPGDPGVTTVKLPFYYLSQLPGGGALRYPIRLFPWVMVALLLAAGSALTLVRRALGSRGEVAARGLVIVLFVVTVAESRVLFPDYARFWSSELPTATFYEEVADEAFETLMILPAKPATRNGYLLDVIALDRPLLNGYWGGDSNVEVPRHEDEESARAGFVEETTRLGARYLVIRLDLVDPSYLEQRSGLAPGHVADHGPAHFWWLDRYCGYPRIYAADAMAVYTLPVGR